jgi:hypothetical protein
MLRPVRLLLAPSFVVLLSVSCSGDDENTTELGDNDSIGDGDGSSTTDDGDGDSTGDGDSSGDVDSTGDGDLTTTDGETTSDGCGAGEELCDGTCANVQSDDLNCGSCGNVCDVVGTTGGCTNGACAPALSECVIVDDPPRSCNEICGDFEKICVDLGCNGMTFYWYGSSNACEQLAGTENTNDCTHPMVQAGVLIRCCCQ